MECSRCGMVHRLHVYDITIRAVLWLMYTLMLTVENIGEYFYTIQSIVLFSLLSAVVSGYYVIFLFSSICMLCRAIPFRSIVLLRQCSVRTWDFGGNDARSRAQNRHSRADLARSMTCREYCS